MKILKVFFITSLFVNIVLSSNEVNEVNSLKKINKNKHNPRNIKRNKSEIEIIRKGLIIDNVYSPFIEDIKDKEKKEEYLKQ